MISVFCVYISVLLLFVFCFIYVPMCCLCSLCIDKLFVRSVFFLMSCVMFVIVFILF